MDSRKNWRGFVSVEADTVALREPYGRDIRQIFVDQDSIAHVREETVQIGGGAVNVELTWDDLEGNPPTDAQLPGLASLLRYSPGAGVEDFSPQSSQTVYLRRQPAPAATLQDHPPAQTPPTHIFGAQPGARIRAQRLLRPPRRHTSVSAGT